LISGISLKQFPKTFKKLNNLNRSGLILKSSFCFPFAWSSFLKTDGRYKELRRRKAEFRLNPKTGS
jgi:hypothetical protein